jgi:hypothetical protein
LFLLVVFLQGLLAKDLTAKIRAVELALARGANILDAVMSRKHDRETELDSRCRDMYIQQHEACVKMYRHFFQTLCDKEDKRDQLFDHLEQLKHQFENAVKIANFSEIGRIKELMKRVDADLIKVSREIEEGASLIFSRYKACWELERVLYQRFRLSDSTSVGEETNLDALSEDPSLVPLKFESTTTWKPRPQALEPFLVMRMEPNVVKNPQFKEGRTAWSCNDSTELSLRESADHEYTCVARCTSSGQGILVQQRDISVFSETEYLFNVRSAMSNADRVLSLFVERQDGHGSGRCAVTRYFRPSRWSKLGPVIFVYWLLFL